MVSLADYPIQKQMAWCLACLCALVLACAGPCASSLATEIGLPLCDPRFSVTIQAHSASKSQQGDYTVYQLEGGVRITQGSFRASCSKANLWVLSQEIPPNEDSAGISSSTLRSIRLR